MTGTSTGPTSGLAAASQVADALLFEGYLLYPYRASATKNQVRWQFGVLAPPAVAETVGEHSWSQTECLIDGPASEVQLQVRFLHLWTRPAGAEGDGEWDEGTQACVDADFSVAELLAASQEVPVRMEAGEVEAEGVTYRLEEVKARAVVGAEALPGPYGTVRLRVRVENTSTWTGAGAGRNQVLRRSLVGTHVLASVKGGRFISLLEPPEWAAAMVAACENVRSFPVLVGDRAQADVILASPIIVYDYPQVAPESPGDLFDATEIDEILTLRTLALTDAEKDEARATDPRAAAIIDRSDAMPPEVLGRLHGAVRSLRPARPASTPPGAPQSDHSAGPGRSQSGRDGPELPRVDVGGVPVGPGSWVVLAPGRRRADAQDMFLQGREAVVDKVLADVDGATYLAVTLAEDPAADLHQAHGRFLYFDPSEVLPIPQAADRAATDKVVTDKVVTDKVVTDKVVTDKVVTDKVVTDKVVTDKVVTDKVVTDKVVTDKAAAVKRVLVAGIGNIFLGDDGFGVEVARRLAEEELPEGVEVLDVGIRGVHLAYQLMEGYDTLILVDAAPRGEPPGTLTVVQPDVAEVTAAAAQAAANGSSPLLDAHALEPVALLAAALGMGAAAGETLVVGCEPATTAEGIGLSPAVEGAVPEAVALVMRLARQGTSGAAGPGRNKR